MPIYTSSVLTLCLSIIRNYVFHLLNKLDQLERYMYFLNQLRVCGYEAVLTYTHSTGTSGVSYILQRNVPSLHSLMKWLRIERKFLLLWIVMLNAKRMPNQCIVVRKRNASNPPWDMLN